jgi:hypothetical protein
MRAAMTAPKATRVMKARRSGRVACGHYVLTGKQIVSRGEGWRRRWLCMECALGEFRSERPAEAGRHSQQEG